MTDKHKHLKLPAQRPERFSNQSVLNYVPILLMFIVALSTAIFIHIASAEAGTGNSAAPDAEPLIFLGNHRLPPMNYLENEQAKGLVVEIVEAMAERMERPVTIKLMDWAEAQELVLAGEADALIQINATEERELLFEFSEPLLESEFAIFIPADKPGITSKLDLRGLTVATEEKGFSIIVLQRDPLINIRPVPDLLSGFNLLLEGTVDAVAGDRWVGTYILAANNIKGVSIAEQPIDIQYSSIAVKKGNALLLTEINRALGEIRDDGTYQRIIDRWQRKEVVYQTVEQVRQQRLIIAASFAALFLALVFALVLYYLVKKSRQTEQALRESEERYRSFISQVSDAVYRFEMTEPMPVDLPVEAQIDYLYDHTCLAEYNQAFPKMYQIDDPAALIGKPLLYLHGTRDNPVNRQTIQQFITSGYKVENKVTEEVDNTGKPKFFNNNALGIIENDHFVRMWGTQADITERKKAEEAIHTLNKELEQRVKERTINLEALNKELTSFAYSISHDFRAPLRALDAFSAGLNETYGDQLDEKGRHYLDRIRYNSQYMSNLIDSLLKLSRITRTEVNPQEVDLSCLAEERIQLLRETEPQRRVAAKIAPGLTARGDRALLRAALDNLLENAWKFSEKEVQAEIEVGRTKIDGEEVFFVRDNGVGFNMAYADKLFDVFQRLHAVDEFPGTGIGLATVQRIINRHGGRIWAESEVGKGATFYFTLPG